MQSGKGVTMKLIKAVLLSSVLIGATASGSAKADNFGWGLLFGTLVAAPVIASAHYRPYYYGPYGYGPYYSYGPAYYPQPGYVQPTYTLPAYVQQAPAPAVRQPVSQAHFWYFCPGSNAYYPYVSTCPGGWQPVSPVPQGMQ